MASKGLDEPNKNDFVSQTKVVISLFNNGTNGKYFMKMLRIQSDIKLGYTDLG